MSEAVQEKFEGLDVYIQNDQAWNELIEKVKNLDYYFQLDYDGTPGVNEDYEDDGFIHINRGCLCVSFYNGQEEGCLKPRHVKKYSKLVNKILGFD